MMNRIGMICIFLAFSVDLKASSRDLTNRLCVTDYWNTISCSLKLPATSFRNTSYWLEFHGNFDKFTNNCSLQNELEDHNCHFTEVTNTDNYTVTFNYLEDGKKNSYLLDAGFIPAKNIKPKTPFNLTLQNANETYCFFWKCGYETHEYRSALPLTYEFLFYKDGDFHNVSVRSEKETIQIEMKLDPGTSYTAMVRTGIREKDYCYHGTWSDWSRTVKWRTANRDEPDQAGKIVMGMLLILGVIIFLIFIPAARFKMKEITLVPTPATYFQPLYQNYQGNFQCWLLAKSPLQDVHVMEDFSTIDKISEVINTLQIEEQVEKTVIYPPAQCHHPYVGPSAEVWAPCRMPDACSEMSIPFEEFSLFCEELPGKVDELMQSVSVACLSGEVVSLKDSALSLENLEDSEPSEAPLIVNPTPVCFKQDYCTLTDTPAGPVPTFTRQVQLDEIISNE